MQLVASLLFTITGGRFCIETFLIQILLFFKLVTHALFLTFFFLKLLEQGVFHLLLLNLNVLVLFVEHNFPLGLLSVRDAVVVVLIHRGSTLGCVRADWRPRNIISFCSFVTNC